MTPRKWTVRLVAAALGVGAMAVGAAPAHATVPSAYLVQYRAHVQNVGWQPYVSDGATAGTTGRSLQLEALNAQLDSAVLPGAHLCYTGYLGNGTTSSACDNGQAGTTGQRLPMQGVELTLVGAPGWDVCYLPHVSNVGWEGWACDGTYAGGAGNSAWQHLEALQIVLQYNHHSVTTVASNVVTGPDLSTSSGFHVRTSAQINLVEDAVTGQALAAYLAATTHTWSQNIFAGFHAQTDVSAGPTYWDSPSVTTYANPQSGTHTTWLANMPLRVAVADWNVGNPALYTHSSFK